MTASAMYAARPWTRQAVHLHYHIDKELYSPGRILTEIWDQQLWMCGVRVLCFSFLFCVCVFVSACGVTGRCCKLKLWPVQAQ